MRVNFVQPGTLVRKVRDDAARDRLVSNVVGHLKNGVTEPVFERAFQYWRNIGQKTGDRIRARKAAEEGEIGGESMPERLRDNPIPSKANRP